MPSESVSAESGLLPIICSSLSLSPSPSESDSGSVGETSLLSSTPSWSVSLSWGSEPCATSFWLLTPSPSLSLFGSVFWLSLWSGTPSLSVSVLLDSRASMVPSPSLSVVPSVPSLIPSPSVSALSGSVPFEASSVLLMPSASLSVGRLELSSGLLPSVTSWLLL